MNDVIEAWRYSEQGREEWLRREARYRETVRKAIAEGVRQVDIAKALDRTREMVRRDAMPEDQREKLKASRRRSTT